MGIHRGCMRDQVRDRILARILSGEYQPGMRLKEMALAAECAVSQAPVREALRELEALGLVECERYRGTRVRSADATELREAYELRMLLEENAVQHAVPLSPERLARLEKDYQRMHGALGSQSLDEYADAVIAFHRLLVEAGGNRTVLAAWDNLHWEVRSRVAMQRLAQLGASMDEYVSAHRRILDQLKAGEGKAAGRMIRELIQGLIDRIAPFEPVQHVAAKNRKPATAAKKTPRKVGLR